MTCPNCNSDVADALRQQYPAHEPPPEDAEDYGDDGYGARRRRGFPLGGSELDRSHGGFSAWPRPLHAFDTPPHSGPGGFGFPADPDEDDSFFDDEDEPGDFAAGASCAGSTMTLAEAGGARPFTIFTFYIYFHFYHGPP